MALESACGVRARTIAVGRRTSPCRAAAWWPPPLWLQCSTTSPTVPLFKLLQIFHSNLKFGQNRSGRFQSAEHFCFWKFCQIRNIFETIVKGVNLVFEFQIQFDLILLIFLKDLKFSKTKSCSIYQDRQPSYNKFYQISYRF